MILIKNVTIIDPSSEWNGEKQDILIVEGFIKDIGTIAPNKAFTTIDRDDLLISPGWLDIGTQIGEPGYEHREDLNSVSAAAVAGGYTGLACFPNTKPAIHSKSEVSFLKNHRGITDFYPIGALSIDCKGVDLAEIYDMTTAGAVAFSDGQYAIQSAGLMKRGLEYLKGINGLLINHPNDATLAKGGQLHEGIVSTQLGMKGMPTLAETLMLKRDLDLLEYTASRLHVYNISSKASLSLIKEAKGKKRAVTASVSAMNLFYDHHRLAEFDVNYKLNPPLRTSEDCEALVEGLKEGAVDIVTSSHTPLEVEAKQLEFPYADFGIIGLETTYALLNTQLNQQFSQSELVQILAIKPRKVLNLSIPVIAKGQKANLTLFQPNREWIFTGKDIFSKSTNTPFVGSSFKGKVAGVINGDFSRFFN